jgi:hypothetical protein
VRDAGSGRPANGLPTSRTRCRPAGRMIAGYRPPHFGSRSIQRCAVVGVDLEWKF